MIRQNMVRGVVICVGNQGVQVQSENWEYSGCVTVSLTSHHSTNYWVERWRVEGGAPREISDQSQAQSLRV